MCFVPSVETVFLLFACHEKGRYGKVLVGLLRVPARGCRSRFAARSSSFACWNHRGACCLGDPMHIHHAGVVMFEPPEATIVDYLPPIVDTLEIGECVLIWHNLLEGN